MTDSKKKFRYFQIYQEIRDQIEVGRIPSGTQLPTEAELQKTYGVSRDTIRKALQKLEMEGIINRRAALGTFVRSAKSVYALSSMSSFSEQMRSRGVVPSSDLKSIDLTAEIRADIREALQLGPEDRCYIVKRIRRGDGIPMAFEETYIPAALCPNIQKYIDENASLYEIYENVYGLKIGDANIDLEAIIPPLRYQTALSLPKESPVLFMRCSARQQSGAPLYYVECYYSGNSYVFSAHVMRGTA